MRDWSGPLSLCSFGSEKTGTFANFFLRSILERDLERFGVVNLFRGTSSLLYVRSLAPGYLIGDGFFLVSFSSWGLLFVGGPGILVWSERALEGPGSGVLKLFSFSEKRTFVNSSSGGNSSSEDSTSPSSGMLSGFGFMISLSSLFGWRLLYLRSDGPGLGRISSLVSVPLLSFEFLRSAGPDLGLIVSRSSPSDFTRFLTLSILSIRMVPSLRHSSFQLHHHFGVCFRGG